MRKNIIFDLDLTLVDTTVAEPYRSKRDWNGAYSVLPQCSVYEGLQDIFDYVDMEVRNNKWESEYQRIRRA